MPWMLQDKKGSRHSNTALVKSTEDPEDGCAEGIYTGRMQLSFRVWVLPGGKDCVFSVVCFWSGMLSRAIPDTQNEPQWSAGAVGEEAEWVNTGWHPVAETGSGGIDGSSLCRPLWHCRQSLNWCPRLPLIRPWEGERGVIEIPEQHFGSRTI